LLLSKREPQGRGSVPDKVPSFLLRTCRLRGGGACGQTKAVPGPDVSRSSARPDTYCGYTLMFRLPCLVLSTQDKVASIILPLVPCSGSGKKKNGWTVVRCSWPARPDHSTAFGSTVSIFPCRRTAGTGKLTMAFPGEGAWCCNGRRVTKPMHPCGQPVAQIMHSHVSARARARTHTPTPTTSYNSVTRVAAPRARNGKPPARGGLPRLAAEAELTPAMEHGNALLCSYDLASLGVDSNHRQVACELGLGQKVLAPGRVCRKQER